MLRRGHPGQSNRPHSPNTQPLSWSAQWGQRGVGGCQQCATRQPARPRVLPHLSLLPHLSVCPHLQVIILSAVRYHVSRAAWRAWWKPLWLASTLLNSAYSFYWDVERDWEISWFSQMGERQSFKLGGCAWEGGQFCWLGRGGALRHLP